MPFRKFLIRIMLWALGITAVVGATTVLAMGMGETGWKLVGTGMATAISAGVMIPFSFLADKPKSRLQGLLGMTLVVLEFVGVLLLIWEIPRLFGDYRLEEQVALSMLFFALTGLPAVFFLRLASIPASSIAGLTGLALAAIVFVALMVGVWLQDRPWIVQSHWFDTAGATATFGLLGVASLAGVGVEPRRWIGVGMSILGLGIALYAIWVQIESESATFTTIVSVAAVMAFANLCLFVPLTASQNWLRVVTILAGMACAAAIDGKALAEEYHLNFAMAENLAAAAGIVASCGSLALLVLARINRNLDRVPVLSEIRQMTVICPGCTKKQTLNVGDSSCPSCGLKFSIKLEEPRCPKCDYLLFMLQSDRCPECGELVVR